MKMYGMTHGMAKQHKYFIIVTLINQLIYYYYCQLLLSLCNAIAGWMHSTLSGRCKWPPENRRYSSVLQCWPKCREYGRQLSLSLFCICSALATSIWTRMHPRHVFRVCSEYAPGSHPCKQQAVMLKWLRNMDLVHWSCLECTQGIIGGDMINKSSNDISFCR